MFLADNSFSTSSETIKTEKGIKWQLITHTEWNTMQPNILQCEEIVLFL